MTQAAETNQAPQPTQVCPAGMRFRQPAQCVTGHMAVHYGGHRRLQRGISPQPQPLCSTLDMSASFTGFRKDQLWHTRESSSAAQGPCTQHNVQDLDPCTKHVKWTHLAVQRNKERANALLDCLEAFHQTPNAHGVPGPANTRSLRWRGRQTGPGKPRRSAWPGSPPSRPCP